MSKGAPIKTNPRHHSSVTPRLHKPAGYGMHPAVLPSEHLATSVVKGIPMVKWPCDNAKTSKFTDRALMGSTEQLPPTESQMIPQRKRFGGISS